MDPFSQDSLLKGSVIKPKLHIRIQQRNGRKCITTIEGWEEDLDLKRICKAMRAAFSCNGNLVEDEDAGTVLQLQGDQRDNARIWILEQEIIGKSEADRIVVHGF
jgi:translation initiation factor 1